MIEFLPFRREHLAQLYSISDPNGGAGAPITQEVLKCMEKGHAFTLLVEGKAVAAGGAIHQWGVNYRGWAYISAAAAPYMLPITKAMKKGLEAVGPGRIEITVQRNFEQGNRWAKMLGFRVETPLMEKWGPDCADYVGYVRMQG